MKIQFKKIRWRNFLATGNSWTEIDLCKDRKTLFVGENGAGKSTLLDALCFVLFNKPYRKINKPQLINAITRKECQVEVEFEVKGQTYNIVRGMKPNIFEIWKNGELINQDAASKDYQQHLEKNILRTNFKTFCQIVILGSAGFVPFMQLPAGQRREIIEDLLDLQIFTTMNSILKDKHGDIDKSVFTLEKDLSAVSERLRMSRVHAQLMIEEKEQQIVDKETKIKSYHEMITSALDEVNVIQSEVSDYQSITKDFSKLQKRKTKLETLRTQIKQKITLLQNEIEFLNTNSNCPTCEQCITPEHKVEAISVKQGSINESNDGLEKLEVEYKKHIIQINELEKISAQINEKNVNIYVLNSKIEGWRKNIDELNKEIKNLNITRETIVDDIDIGSLEKKLQDLQTQEVLLKRDKYMMNYVSVLLKDTGIKSRIIKQYTPIINKLINKYMADLDFFVDFNLSENFEETIKSRHRDDFSYHSFSEGQKMRIDLAVLFAWRAVSKLRSSINTNLLIMDEVFDSSLDAGGTEEFMKILSKVTDDNNVIIISHKTDQLWDNFEKIVKFELVNNFSRVAS